MKNICNIFLSLTLGWPEKISTYLAWLAPLFARLVVGEVFMVSGWGKLNNLDIVTGNFISWGIPLPQVLTPFVAGAEFVGGILLILGLFTRIAAGMLGVIMIVAIYSALWPEVNSLDTLLGFEETAYLVLFTWIAIAGAGTISVDYLLVKNCTFPSK
jgi:putative oxidoreductase